MYRNLLIIFLILFDLLVKQIIFYLIDLNNFIYVTSFFDLAHIHNFGISFGLFSGLFPSWFFILIGSIYNNFPNYFILKISKYIGEIRLCFVF